MYQLHIKIIELRGDVMFVMFFDISDNIWFMWLLIYLYSANSLKP